MLGAKTLMAGVVVFFLITPEVLFAQDNQVYRGNDTNSNTLARVGAPHQADSNRPVPDHRNTRYRICRDDVMVISFPLAPELVQTVTVQPDGYIALQGAGSLLIQGLTVPQVAEAIKKAYSGILHDPIIDVSLIDFQRPFYIVSGQVNKPGQYDLRYDTTVTEAIAVAGGFASTAKTQIFLFHRISPDWAEVKKLKLNGILNGKTVNEDVHMMPGDMIFVPEKAITKFRKYVPYSIGTNINSASTPF